MMITNDYMNTHTFENDDNLVMVDPPEYDEFSPDDVDCDYCGKNVAVEATEFGLVSILLCSNCQTMYRDEINYQVQEI